jgi:predicted flap endonuclease-1-like 5' DNA nuclease
MMYLIAQLSGWLLLTAGFAGLGGWAFAALRALPAEAALRRERDGLMRDLRAISAENAGLGSALSPETERELDTLRRRADLDAARIAEMARALAGARDRAQEAQGRVAELERAAERRQTELADLSRTNEEAARVAQPVLATPVASTEATLQDWRLRYFEQRVRYLESQARLQLPAPEPVVSAPADPSWEWRARTAEARVAHAEEELRAAQMVQASPPAPARALELEEGPFAANADADMLLRWRMLYLEKRVAYLQGEQHAETPDGLVAAMDAEEAEKWKWRARYLEARTRRLEQHLSETPGLQGALLAAAAPMIESAPEPQAEPMPAQPLIQAERPPKLAAPQGGLPDDFTLIDGVSGIQQTTLNSLGIFHFEQIAAWSDAHVAWIDKYLRLRGRVAQEEWVEQAQELAEHGVDAARRVDAEEQA